MKFGRENSCIQNFNHDNSKVKSCYTQTLYTAIILYYIDGTQCFLYLDFYTSTILFISFIIKLLLKYHAKYIKTPSSLSLVNPSCPKFNSTASRTKGKRN